MISAHGHASNQILREAPVDGSTPSSATLPHKDSLIQSATASTDLSSVSNWPMVLLSLFFILLMIVVLGYVARRFSGFSAGAGQSMKVLSALQVGTRERVALIEVHGKQLVVGVTQHNINLLHSFDHAPVTDTVKAGSKSDFSQKLQALLQGKSASAQLSEGQPVASSQDELNQVGSIQGDLNPMAKRQEKHTTPENVQLPRTDGGD